MGDAMTEFLSPLETTFKRGALRFAVQQTIFCPRSKVILDIRTSVLVTVTLGETSQTVCLHGDAYDKLADELKSKADTAGVTVEIIDGRVINKRPSRAKLKHEG